MSLRACRVLAILLATAILAWQLGNAYLGRFLHGFLVPDLAVSVILFIGATRRADRSAAAWMLAGFAGTAGVFLSATSVALVEGRYGIGPGSTTVGLIPCVFAAGTLGRRLVTAATVDY